MSNSMRNLDELIDREDSGYLHVQEWIQTAEHQVEVLPKDPDRAQSELLQAQITTRSLMGSILYETGGILVARGWIRILGSGSPRLDRGMMRWNFGKTFQSIDEAPAYLLVADDVVGGFFALNGGGIDAEDLGKIFYLAPDTLDWEATGLSYSEFLQFCFAGDHESFYEAMRWKGWERDLERIDGNHVMTFYPYLWTKEGKDINKIDKKIISIEEAWNFNQEIKKQIDQDR